MGGQSILSGGFGGGRSGSEAGEGGLWGERRPGRWELIELG